MYDKTQQTNDQSIELREKICEVVENSIPICYHQLCIKGIKELYKMGNTTAENQNHAQNDKVITLYKD
jgi:hypothetical protein